MQEVSGSIPLTSTKGVEKKKQALIAARFLRF